MPKSVMMEILKLAKAPKEYVQAALNMRCTACDVTADPKQTSKVSPPSLNYVFNHNLGADVFDLRDYEGKCWLFLNIVCLGTDFQIVSLLGEGRGNHLQRHVLMRLCRAG